MKSIKYNHDKNYYKNYYKNKKCKQNKINIFY